MKSCYHLADKWCFSFSRKQPHTALSCHAFGRPSKSTTHRLHSALSEAGRQLPKAANPEAGAATRPPKSWWEASSNITKLSLISQDFIEFSKTLTKTSETVKWLMYWVGYPAVDQLRSPNVAALPLTKPRLNLMRLSQIMPILRWRFP